MTNFKNKGIEEQKHLFHWKKGLVRNVPVTYCGLLNLFHFTSIASLNPFPSKLKLGTNMIYEMLPLSSKQQV